MITAAGTIFLAKDTSRVLLNFRAQKISKGSTFGFWGGKMEHGETVMECLHREINEECGFVPEYSNILPLDIYTSDDKQFMYYSFVTIVDSEFIPRINEESDGYLWCNMNHFPRQLHTGAKMILGNSSYIKNIKKILKDL